MALNSYLAKYVKIWKIVSMKNKRVEIIAS